MPLFPDCACGFGPRSPRITGSSISRVSVAGGPGAGEPGSFASLPLSAGLSAGLGPSGVPGWSMRSGVFPREYGSGFVGSGVRS